MIYLGEQEKKMSRFEHSQLKSELMPHLNDSKEDYALHLEKVRDLELKIKDETNEEELAILRDKLQRNKEKVDIKYKIFKDYIEQLADLGKRTDFEWAQ